MKKLGLHGCESVHMHWAGAGWWEKVECCAFFSSSYNRVDAKSNVLWQDHVNYEKGRGWNRLWEAETSYGGKDNDQRLRRPSGMSTVTQDLHGGRHALSAGDTRPVTQQRWLWERPEEKQIVADCCHVHGILPNPCSPKMSLIVSPTLKKSCRLAFSVKFDVEMGRVGLGTT